MTIQQSTTPPLQFLTEKEVAELTGFSLSKIQQDRFYRRGIPYSKAGRCVRYLLQDVLHFMEQHKVQHGE